MVTVSAIGFVQVLALPIVARRARDAGARPEIHRTPRSDPLTRVSRSRQVDPAATCLVTGGRSGTDQRDTADTL